MDEVAAAARATAMLRMSGLRRLAKNGQVYCQQHGAWLQCCCPSARPFALCIRDAPTRARGGVHGQQHDVSVSLTLSIRPLSVSPHPSQFSTV